MSDTKEKKTYKVKINDISIEVEKSVITGSELLEAVGMSAQASIIYELLSDGEMENLRAHEATDLTKPGTEKFLTFETDKIFRIEVNQISLEWGAPVITGRALKRLAKVDIEKYDVVQMFNDGSSIVIEENDTVDISKKGIEKFITRAIKKTVTVCYGDTEFEIEKGEYTTENLMKIFGVPEGYILQLVNDGDFITLSPGQVIKIKKHMKFISHAPVGCSS